MKSIRDISDEMRELGYDCTPEMVERVRDGETIHESAALAGNILHALDEAKIKREERRE